MITGFKALTRLSFLVASLSLGAPAWAGGMQANHTASMAWSANALSALSAARLDDEPENANGSTEDDEAPESEKWADFIEDKDLIEGYFNLYRDRETGELFMEIAPDQIDEEFIYYSYTRDGSRRDGMRVAGLVGENSVLSWRRRYQQVDVISRNTAFSIDEDSPLARSAGTNISNPILITLDIISENDATGAVVVKANDLFMTNSLVRIGQQTVIGRLFGIAQGSLSARKTNIQSVRAYEDNIEVVAEYVFDWSGARTPAAFSDTTTVQHSFVRMPEDGFEPRRADPRVGFFTQRRTNLTRVDGNPAEDLIQRWRLEKTDPDAEVSDVVEPIVFWIENTTPVEYRDYVRRGVLAWNPAFEAAGFRNALSVEIQPDDADWDAGDVRYNVLRWISSPSPLFAGYGPRYTNPRTGEVIGADIVIEHSAVRRWIQTDRLFPESASAAGTGAFEAHDPRDHEASDSINAEEVFEAGLDIDVSEHVAMNAGFAQLASAALAGGGSDPELSQRIVEEGLLYLVVHEVGHTLGLSHNFMGAFYSALDDLNGETGRLSNNLSASIMDYPGINISADRDRQGYYFPTAPGPYDYWAIRFGYAPEIADPDTRTAHLNRSTEPGHVFANDADVMRAPGSGMDPRVNTHSLSTDPIGFAVRQIELSRVTMDSLVDITAVEGASWQETRNAFDLLMGLYFQSVNVIAPFVGGVYSDQAFVGQDNAPPVPLMPVPGDEQKRAIRELGRLIFADDAFDFPPEVIARLQTERRSFDARLRPTEPELQRLVGRVQSRALFYMLNPRALNRLTDSTAYGGDYSAREMLHDLTHEIFSGRSESVYRRNLQIFYVNQLDRIRASGRLQQVPATAIHDTLRRIENMHSGPDFWMSQDTRAHRRFVREMVAQALQG
ncbi:MAG: zinc-dependent metalloprotease [Oceanicaulis sp.]|nr:zinc-dependent metalloprotease [Oceanicaulis sp.]